MMIPESGSDLFKEEGLAPPPGRPYLRGCGICPDQARPWTGSCVYKPFAYLLRISCLRSQVSPGSCGNGLRGAALWCFDGASVRFRCFLHHSPDIDRICSDTYIRPVLSGRGHSPGSLGGNYVRLCRSCYGFFLRQKDTREHRKSCLGFRSSPLDARGLMGYSLILFLPLMRL